MISASVNKLELSLVAMIVISAPAMAQDKTQPAAPAAPAVTAPAPAAPASAAPVTTAPAQSVAPAKTELGSAAAPEPKLQAVKYGDWFLRCTQPQDKAVIKSCEVAQVAQVNDNGKQVTVLTMAFARVPVATAKPADAKAAAKSADKPKDQLVFTALAPLNVFLPAGLNFKFDNKIMPPMEYRNCNEAGCWAQVPIAAKDQTASMISKAKTASAGMQLMNGQKLNLNFSTKGLEEALAEMAKSAAN